MQLLRLLISVLLLALPVTAWAAQSDLYEAPALTAQLITAEQGVAPDAGTLSAGLVVKMQDGWKTYWRSPGEVGLPPELDWDQAQNLATAELQFPAPTRFTAFDIENFGYGDQVVFPIRITLDHPGAPATLTPRVRLLVCKEICIPEDFTLTLTLPNDTGIDPEAAETIAAALSKVPAEGAATNMSLEAAHLSQTHLTVALHRDLGFRTPDVFPELEGAVFGKPIVRLDADQTRLWAEIPLLYATDPNAELTLTVTDGRFAGTLPAPLTDTLPAAPQAGRGLWAMALIAVLGGLILNVMPCVLPVLSLKLAAAIGKSDLPPAQIRAGFLWAAFGVLTFFWALAAATWGLQSMGHAVGWGLQFQSPVFLTLMIVILVLFSAKLFGAFTLSLPSGLQTHLASVGGHGHLGDFATGAFAAVLATPCSAPFLGTAVAFAMAGGGLDIAVIFTALGIGLALPYLAVAAMPGCVAVLPKPGRWMLVVKAVMAGLLALTAAWLFLVLANVAGLANAAITALLVAMILAILILPIRLPRRPVWVAALAVIAVGLPALRPAAPQSDTPTAANWAPFDTTDIRDHIANGKIVFVDVTADWCLTCKANKSLVLERGEVATLLTSGDIIAMQADWTRPDPAISEYLAEFNRYGIPFNAVYGPAAPTGIALPELLSAKAIFQAIEKAGG
ncbi:protein-disulfide reductase DsbD family protein [Marinovum sp. 2_MG-2023]|uniref:protein-disulfide reductase DsbD family protein n=1 Tax=unclassified Marinovum TaxID=2647166 RepID=UPI0026E42BD5|nr:MULTISPECIES: protein-disulfide reductase DsbD domain-containing protein [unclassified Marinovum]MDO6729377.1 protein-disulfide reductase DsbD family protein [Marinovum sp. 2_MG-2023]MDO6780407.1 protein-disulfide reductase DsbD family protein [Marinovum sp. 1_MG-2023]